jgi:hypothetical protein
LRRDDTSFSPRPAPFGPAFPDLDDALAMHPALLAVHRALIRIASANGAPPALERRLLDEALVQCPDCLQVPVAFLLVLESV